MSWAAAPDAVIARPATTARMVANATAEDDADSTTPPSSNASSAEEFSMPAADGIFSGPTGAAQPNTRVNR